ncbi:hypothetical protein RB597_009461 [Gaeumannomyces tritici]
MNSFHDQPYTTSNRSIWLELMSNSTADWGLSPLPAKLVLLNGTLADAPPGSVPADAIVIENAGRKLAGDSPIEAVVLGITSAIAIACFAGFLIYSYWTGSLGLSAQAELPGDNNSSNDMQERRPLGAGGAEAGPDSPTASDAPDGFMTDEAFGRRLRNYYYPPTVTETELRERDYVAEPVGGGDVEAATELLRRMYANDLEIWSRGSDRGFDTAAAKDRSDAMLAEVRARFQAWGAAANGSGCMDWRAEVEPLALREGWQAAADPLECLDHGQAQGVLYGVSGARAGWRQEEVPELLKAGLFLFSPQGIQQRRYS